MDPLEAYRRKRNQGRTPEPMPAPGSAGTGSSSAGSGEPGSAGTGSSGAGSGKPGAAGRFVVQEHHARRLHWDFRLERDGVLVSWALPKGVPDDPAANHLAVRTEDHPLEYAGFAGEIPRGEYGAGTVTIWDRGSYDTLKWDDREVKVTLHGERLTGGYVLFRTGGDSWMIHRERQPLPPHITHCTSTSAEGSVKGK